MRDSRVSAIETVIDYSCAKSEVMQTMANSAIDYMRRGNVVLIQDAQHNPERLEFAAAVMAKLKIVGDAMCVVEEHIPDIGEGTSDLRYKEYVRGLVLVNADHPTTALQHAIARGRELAHVRGVLGFTRSSPDEVRAQLDPKFNARCVYFPVWPKLSERAKDHADLLTRIGRDFPFYLLHHSARATLMQLDGLEVCYELMREFDRAKKAANPNFIGGPLQGTDILETAQRMKLHLTPKPVTTTAPVQTATRLSA